MASRAVFARQQHGPLKAFIPRGVWIGFLPRGSTVFVLPLRGDIETHVRADHGTALARDVVEVTGLIDVRANLFDSSSIQGSFYFEKTKNSTTKNESENLLNSPLIKCDRDARADLKGLQGDHVRQKVLHEHLPERSVRVDSVFAQNMLADALEIDAGVAPTRVFFVSI